MKEWVSQLGQRLPQLALAILAAKQGPQALSSFQGGIREAQQARAGQERQAQLDEERRQQQAAIEGRAEQAADAVEGRAQRDDTRADAAAQFQRAQALIQALSTHDVDPSALAQLYQVPPEQVQAIAGPITTAKEKRAAKDFIEALPKDKRYAGYFQTPEGLEELENTTLTEWRGKPNIKIGQIRAMAEEAQIAPKLEAPKPDVPNTPEEKFYQRFATENGAASFSDLPTKTQAAARRQWMQADDRQPAGGRDTGDPGPLETIIGPDGKAIRVPRKDAVGHPPAAGTEKASSGLQKRVLNFFNRAQQADQDLEAMEPEIETLSVAGQYRQALAPNFAQTQLGQSYTAAQRAFTEARLRKDSGAAIPPHEFESDRKTYFVQPGDTKKTIQDKNRARAAMLASLAFESGQALGEFVGDSGEARAIVDGYKARAAGGAAGAGGTTTKIGRFDVTVTP